MRKNLQVAKILYEIADLLEIQDVQWKPIAYRRAAQTIENLSEDIAELVKQETVQELPGIGEAIAEKIKEIVTTGKLKYLEQLRKEVPVDTQNLFRIEGLGPKTVKLLYNQLKVKNLQQLEQAAKTNKIAQLEGMGEKRQQLILHHLEALHHQDQGRMPLGFAEPIADEIVSILKKVSGVEQVTVAGSFRRGKETVGDLDILAVAKNAAAVMERFVSMESVQEVLARGETKSSVKLQNNLQVDLRVVKQEQYGACLQYFTGSKEHSIALRKIALKKGLTMNEYGIYRVKDKKLVASKTENEVYAKLGLQYIPPEMRENRGEIELAAKNKIPQLIEFKDIKGDFQTQTDWSDGQDSIEAMAKQAQSLGWNYLVITDHVGGIGIANPLDEKRLLKQGVEIDKLNKKFDQQKIDFHIFKGAEIDIKKDGQLWLSKIVCNKLDVVLASIHSAFRMSKEDMTKRLITCFEDYPVHVFGHPFARHINKREPIEFDVEKVFQAAKDNNVYLEINGQPTRMDLPDVHIHTARELGCKFVISSDAHSAEQLLFLKYGVINARRGWLEGKNILNTQVSHQIQKILNIK
ncbi:DNA polymerase/3'-5' exonuclease PolX [Candidatus Woesearchaeota archaeon]|nr:DNA polymerase/3'-5' exonuclease PolX [Candidatus Woesearchaeota archaeon]